MGSGPHQRRSPNDLLQDSTKLQLSKVNCTSVAEKNNYGSSTNLPKNASGNGGLIIGCDIEFLSPGAAEPTSTVVSSGTRAPSRSHGCVIAFDGSGSILRSVWRPEDGRLEDRRGSFIVMMWTEYRLL